MRVFLRQSLLIVTAILALRSHGQGLDAALQAKLDARIKAAQTWAAEPAIVSAVKSYNAGHPADATAMTQEKWKAASVLDPFVRSLTKNPAAELLKTKRTTALSEAFLSGADGTKIAFLTKPSNWSHKGKTKHDDPMSNKVWQGAVEVDESTGQQQVQIAVPVLEDGKPIGSLILGFTVSKLAAE
jgi:hypothetical protein